MLPGHRRYAFFMLAPVIVSASVSSFTNVRLSNPEILVGRWTVEAPTSLTMPTFVSPRDECTNLTKASRLRRRIGDRRIHRSLLVRRCSQQRQGSNNRYYGLKNGCLQRGDAGSVANGQPIKEAASPVAPMWRRVRGGKTRNMDSKLLGKQKLEEGEEDDGEDDVEDKTVDKVADVETCLDDSSAVLSEAEEELISDQSSEDEEESTDVQDDNNCVIKKRSHITTKGPTVAATTLSQSNSLATTLELRKILPKIITHAMVFGIGTWVSRKLSPGVQRQVRAARIIYTAYLIFSQGMCMYLRYLIWQSDDETVMEIPPPPQLSKLMEGAARGPGKGPEIGAATPRVAPSVGAQGSSTGPQGPASSWGPMMEKMLTSKIRVKTYDMKYVQKLRRGHFWASLFMCYTHLSRGMIKPMILQVSFGILALLDSPLFKVYVLGMKAEGDLARPFKKQGLMDALAGPVTGLSAKAEEGRNMQRTAAPAAAPAAAAAAAAKNEESTTTTTTDDTVGQNEEESKDRRVPDVDL